jgi:hypothetical protein
VAKVAREERIDLKWSNHVAKVWKTLGEALTTADKSLEEKELRNVREGLDTFFTTLKNESEKTVSQDGGDKLRVTFRVEGSDWLGRQIAQHFANGKCLFWRAYR